MYHGTQGRNVAPIIRNGFLPNQCQHDCKAVYLSPSIVYASHPRYARVYQHGDRYYQIVLQVRVLNEKIYSEVHAFVGETMAVGGKFEIDEHFPQNQNLEFLYKSDTAVGSEGIIVTGIMMRCCTQDPLLLTECQWWTCFDPKKKLRRLYYTCC